MSATFAVVVCLFEIAIWKMCCHDLRGRDVSYQSFVLESNHDAKKNEQKDRW